MLLRGAAGATGLPFHTGRCTFRTRVRGLAVRAMDSPQPQPSAVVGTNKVPRSSVILNEPRAAAGSQFKVVQWNILADGLAQNGDFIKVPADCLEWPFRKPLVLAELVEAGADVICLQECNHYDELLGQLEALGYAGAFHAKVCSPAERYKCPPDGMAVFYNRRRFTPVGAAKGYTFVDEQGQKQSQGFLQVMLHDNVVQRDVLVVTTHLKAKEGDECELVRVSQARQLLRSVCSTLAAWSAHKANGNGNGHSNNNNTNNGCCAAPGDDSILTTLGSEADSSLDEAALASSVPVLMAGDFNTVPTSATCQAIHAHALRLQSVWDQPTLQASSSGGQQGDATQPPQEFSTWKFRSKGESKRIIDYIWYTGNGMLRPLQRWRMLTEDEIGPCALPSPSYASDHISLCCEFEWDLPHMEWAPSKEEDWG